MIAAIVNISQTIIRYSQPLNGGSSAIPCAIPIVKGLRNAPAKPTPAPTNGMEIPTIESYPRANENGNVIRIKTRTSSLMPNVAPANEKSVITIGMTHFLSRGFRREERTTDCKPDSMAPVLLMIPNAPATKKIKAMICPASINPRMGAMIKSHRLAGLAATE